MRVGLFGTGHWARTVHGPGLASHPGVELVGVWGRRPDQADGAAAALGTRAFRQVDDLIGAVDAVAVALPPDVQAGIAGAAARAGRHLLLDKPLALDPAAARDVADAAAGAGVSSVVFFTARFSPGLAPFWEEVAAGGWAAATVVQLASIFGAGSPYAGSAWRRERGALWDVGPHALAAVTAGLGPVQDVTAVPGPGDQVAIAARHAGSGTSTLVLSLTAAPGARTQAVTFYGPAGPLAQPADPTTASDAYRHAVDALLAAAAGGRPHPCDVRFGAEVVETLAAAEAALGSAG